jgi:hypothetical protein
MTVPARQIKPNQPNPIPSQSKHHMQRVPYQAALTYGWMVRRQHSTLKLKQHFKHRKRIHESSQRMVRHSNVVHGRACTSS